MGREGMHLKNKITTLRQTIVVNGRLAMRTERLQLARNQSTGVQALAIEHLAERLAGGFLKIVPMISLKETIALVLQETNLGELEPIKNLPGMVTAAASTLMKFWLTNLDADDLKDNKRIQAILSLEKAVLDALPSHLKRPADIIDLAVSRARHAKAIFGSITIKGMTDIHPVWRPLFAELSKHVDVVWDAGPREVGPWIDENLLVVTSPPQMPNVTAVECATAKHEVIEAVRWARKLMSQGVPPQKIAIATVMTAAYDDHMVSVCHDADIGIHFVHGVSAVHYKDGQLASALADTLLRGLSQKRVRRLIELIGPGNGILEGLPRDWGDKIKHAASLTELSRWDNIIKDQQDLLPYRQILMPFLTILSKGPSIAAQAGEVILDGKALQIWKRALIEGPAEALDRTIQMQRLEDEQDPLSSPCYMSAESLAASPRPYVRLIGLTSRNWPRQNTEDALIPDYLISTRNFDPMLNAEIDRRDFATIKATTQESLVLSWPRRDEEGRQLDVSRLVTLQERNLKTQVLRTAPPKHALSEADRLFSRSKEYSLTPMAVSAAACWQNWRSSQVTAHDGLFDAKHPRIAEVFSQHMSATSLRTLLRDQLGFVWKYALGFSAPEYEDYPLLADPREFGNIVHDILKQTVRALERKGGFSNQSKDIISRTVSEQAQSVGIRMEMTKPIPPTLIWHGMMEHASQFATSALTSQIELLNGQSSYAEVPFGKTREWEKIDYPWDTSVEVVIPGTDLKLLGYIDRLDLSSCGSTARVIDYKAGKTPRNLEDMVIDGGKEVQRCIYGFATKKLLGENIKIESGLLYPETGKYAPVENLDDTLDLISASVRTAQELLQQGIAIPGIGARETFNEMRFALPANANAVYLLRKNQVFIDKIGDGANVWQEK